MAIQFKTKITEMLGCEYPILCGGMQWVSRAPFVAAVCNGGGFGFITAESLETPEDLRDEIKKIRDLTDRPFGVNVSMVPEFGMPERTLRFCEVICEEGVGFVETAGRSPEPLMPQFKAAGVKVIHKLTSIRHAQKAQKLGVDAVTMIGYGSGGHIGMDNVASFALVPLAVKTLKIPVIAGGGIANGAGFLGALAMGAEAVLLGTAFFATQESPVHPMIKERLVASREVDTCLILNTIRNPIRVVRNHLADDVQKAEAEGAGFEEIIRRVAGGKGKLAYDEGDPEISPIACGQAVGLIDEVKTVGRVIQDIMGEAETMMERLSAMTHP